MACTIPLATSSLNPPPTDGLKIALGGPRLDWPTRINQEALNMNGRVVLILCTLAAFGALTAYAVHVVGYFGILAVGMDG